MEEINLTVCWGTKFNPNLILFYFFSLRNQGKTLGDEVGKFFIILLTSNGAWYSFK